MAIPILILLLLGSRTMGNHDARILPTLHASAGVALVLLVVLRLYWRWKNPPPQRAYKSFLQEWAARLVHIALYAAMFLIPFTGWLAYTEHVRRSLGIRPASWFGLKIPLLPDFGINWHFIHKWGGKVALLFIAIHIAAALKHHFYDKDNTLKRMLP
ncbi:MAG: cytochrome b [Alphaproteobacteria bacterium]|nr:cytochrome b [Alphaproteobacteria bacterium]